MDRDRLRYRLAAAFEASTDERRVVVRAALDLDDSGRYTDVRGHPPTIDALVSELREAPDDLDLVDRWNWWIGALDLAHGGFDGFRVRRWRGD